MKCAKGDNTPQRQPSRDAQRVARAIGVGGWGLGGGVGGAAMACERARGRSEVLIFSIFEKLEIRQEEAEVPLV